MEQKVVQPWVTGLILSLALIAFSIVLYVTGQSENKIWGWVQSLLIMATLIWSCINYAKQMNGNVSYGNVFAHGFKTTAAMIAIFSVYTFISSKYIFPEMIDKLIERATKEMEAKGNVTDEQINAGLSVLKKFFIPISIGTIMLTFSLLGAIASAIGAGIAKKNPNPTPFDQ